MQLKKSHTCDRKLVHRKLIIPLTGVFLLLISGFSVTLLISYQRNREKFNHFLWNNIVNSQNILLARKAHVLTTLLDVLAQEENLEQNLQTGNRQQLYVDYAPVFKKLQKQVSINHFHFFKPGRISLLRLGEPDQYGDCTDRLHLREAAQTGKVVWGLELEKSSFFSLMIAKPIYKDDTLIGYIELGQEITGLLNSMHQWLDVELAITVRKNGIEQNSWATATRRLGKSYNWDRYEQDVLAYTTLPDLPPESDMFIHGTTQHRLGRVSGVLEFDNKLWDFFIFPMKDASGSEKGDLYIFHDITEPKLAFIRLVINTLGIALVLTISLLYCFSVVLKQIDRTIQQQYGTILSRERKLNEAQHIARVGSWEYNFSANTFSFSNEFYRILGLHPRQTDINYSTFLNYIHPDDRLYVKSAYIKSRKTKKPFSITHRLLLDDGTRKTVNTLCEIFYKTTGEPIRLIGTLHDITEKKQIGEALKKSENRYRHLIETTSEGLWMVDKEFRTVEVNESLCKMLGYSKNEILGKNPLDLLIYEGRPPYTAQKNLFKNAIHRNHDGYLKKSDGANLPVMVRATTMRNAAGEIEGAFAFISDLTEIKQKEKTLIRIKAELEKNYSLLQGIINNSLAVIYVKDHDGKYILINDEYKKSFNICDNEIIGKTDFDIFPTELACELKRNDQAIFQKNTPIQFEEVIQHDDGIHTYLSQKFPLVSKDGITYAIACISTDITERKKLENKILEINERLTTLINASPDIICFKDGAGRWLLANDTDLELFELSGVDYKGKTDAELAEYSAFYREAFLNCMESDEETWKKGVLVQSKEVIPTPVGEDKIYQIVKVPLFNPNGTRKGLVVLGHDITEHLKTEKRLRKETEAHLRTSEIIEQKRKEAEEANTTLRVLLSQQKKVEEELQQNIIAQLERVAFPYIELLGQCLLDDNGKKYLNILSGHLRLIGSSFIRKLNSPDLGLTKREILVADLVRQGKSTKEIAQLLFLRPRSVESYRNKIRKKLHLNSKKIRLEQYLQSRFPPK